MRTIMGGPSAGETIRICCVTFWSGDFGIIVLIPECGNIILHVFAPDFSVSKSKKWLNLHAEFKTGSKPHIATKILKTARNHKLNLNVW